MQNCLVHSRFFILRKMTHPTEKLLWEIEINLMTFYCKTLAQFLSFKKVHFKYHIKKTLKSLLIQLYQWSLMIQILKDSDNILDL